jgi:hypothetical protein
MSKKITVELYGHPGNNAVVRMPDRQNPGVVIQADTLGSLADDARVLANVIRANGLSALVANDAAALADRLQEIFARVEEEMALAGERLKR